jgi:hypothetical protein
VSSHPKTSNRTRPAILEYLSSHPNTVVYLKQISKATGLTDQQVQSQIRNMINDKFPIGVVVRAQAWTFTPAAGELGSPDAKPDTRGTLYEEIGRTKNGKPVLQDADGVIYIATEVEA